VRGDSITNSGVYGSSTSNYGVHVISDSKYGVYGKSTLSHGVLGASTSGSGVYGNSTEKYGIYGESTSSYGVYGKSTSGYGVYAASLVSKAGYFAGDINVTGYLTKAGGGFQIDHPLKPENKYLNHSSVESSDMKNVYDGIVVLDAAGEAWIEMPEWFDALNRDFRYQLTCIGEFAPVYIAEKIDEASENEFKIAGGYSGLEVSWQVTGIREDPWANANRPVVEEDKPAG
jgi:hypothetical protein